MSAAPLRQQRPASRPASPEPRRREHLRAVSAPAQARSLVPFTFACLAIILGSLVAVLIINTSMAKGAYERRDLKIEIADLHQQRATLLSELEGYSSPQLLANKAVALGMEPAPKLGFVSLESGTVLEAEGN
jgi:hypothetical protein